MSTTAPISHEFPLKVVTGANRWEHWSKRSARARTEKQVVAFEMQQFKSRRALPPLPAVVTFTRLAPQKCDDDNLAGAFKAARDAVAALYGVDDGDERWTWRYAQERAKQYGTRIRIESITPATPAGRGA